MRLIATTVMCLSSAFALAGTSTPKTDVIHRPVKPTAQTPTEAIGYSASHMDRSLDPRQDFCACANGNWLKRQQIPDAESDIGGFSMLGAKLDGQLQRLAMQATQGQAPKGSPSQQVGDFFRAALDMRERDAAGLQPLQPAAFRCDPAGAGACCRRRCGRRPACSDCRTRSG